MNKNILIAVIIFGIFILGVYLFRMNLGMKPADKTTMSGEVTPAVQQKVAVGVYEGDLPCADCEGIKAVLTLNEDLTYTMSNTYLGRDVEPYVETGTWTTLRGDATDPNATVYQLSSGSPETKQNYLLAGDQLKQLDSDLQLIEAPFNTSLTKKAQ